MRVANVVSHLIPSLMANLPLVLLSAALLLGGIWAYRLWQDMRAEEDDEDDSPLSLFDHIRAAHAAGEIDDAEFDRVRRRFFKIGPEDSGTRAPATPDGESRGQPATEGTMVENERGESESPTAPAE